MENRLDKDGLPEREGVYLVKGIWENSEGEIDVYIHPIKGLCCYADDFGSAGTGVDDRYGSHVSVPSTGLEFIRRRRNLGVERMKLFIACSKHFYDRIPEIENELKLMGHEVSMPNSYDAPLMEEEMKKKGLEAHVQ